MDVPHEHTDFEAQILFLGSEGLYSLFDRKSKFFLLLFKIPDRSHFLKVYIHFLTEKVSLFWCYSKFPIEGCITRTY
jgi:hypothetical protein